MTLFLDEYKRVLMEREQSEKCLDNCSVVPVTSSSVNEKKTDRTLKDVIGDLERLMRDGDSILYYDRDIFQKHIDSKNKIRHAIQTLESIND